MAHLSWHLNYSLAKLLKSHLEKQEIVLLQIYLISILHEKTFDDNEIEKKMKEAKDMILA